MWHLQPVFATAIREYYAKCKFKSFVLLKLSINENLLATVFRGKTEMLIHYLLVSLMRNSGKTFRSFVLCRYLSILIYLLTGINIFLIVSHKELSNTLIQTFDFTNELPLLDISLPKESPTAHFSLLVFMQNEDHRNVIIGGIFQHSILNILIINTYYFNLILINALLTAVKVVD